MDWLKKNYDLALLGLASLAVAASAALFALGGPGESDQPTLPPMPQRPDAQAPASPIEAVRQATALLESAPTTAPKNQSEAALRGSPFVSRPYLLKDGKLFDPIEGGEDLHPPLTNAWVIANNLDYSNPGLATADPDNDKFTNEEEFLGKTNPNDPLSTPPSFTKLRLVRFTPIPFRIEFKGDPSGEGTEFQINLRDLKGSSRTQYKKIGDTIEAGPDRPPYKILSYAKKEAPNARGVLSDISELTIENASTGEKIVLLYNQELNDPSSVGIFRNELTGAELTLKKDEEFTLPPDEQTKLKVVDISETSAQIQDLKTGVVSKVSKAETEAPATQ